MSSRPATLSFLGLRYLRGGSRTSIGPYAVATADQLGRLLLPHAQRSRPAPDIRGAVIAVAKIDHLGDLLIATPVLSEIRRQRPTARIVLIVGSWCGELAERLRVAGLCHEIVLYDHWGLNRGVRKFRALLRHWRSHRRAVDVLSELAPAAFLDLRPRSPNTLWLAESIHAPYRVGFGLRGLSYTLHREIPYRADRSLGQLYLDSLPMLSLEASTYRGPILSGPCGEVAAPSQRQLPRPYVVAHFASGAGARDVPEEDWRTLLGSVAETATVVAVGSMKDRHRYQHIGAALPESRWINLMGATPIDELAGIVRESAGGVVVDSLVAHLLVAYDRPALVLMRPGISQRTSFPDVAPAVRFENVPLGTRNVSLSY